jgi:hypothetical protein
MDIADLKAPEPASGVPPWRDPEWLAAADAWISDRCAEAGLERAGSVQLRCRPWAVVGRVPIAGREPVWFKANSPGAAFEPALLDALGRWAPDHALPLIAVDTRRAWSLARDCGDTLVELMAGDRDIRRWHQPLLRYAELQHALADRVPELLALGLPDARPAELPDRLEALIDGQAAAPLAEDGLDQKIRALIPELRRQCAELDDIGVPATIDHGDLHGANIFVIDGRPVPFDWGDAALAHPFNTLTVLRGIARECGVPAEGPAADALLSAYLEPWAADGFAAADLRRAVRLALRVAPIARALTWGRLFPCFALSAEPAANAAAWLGRLLVDRPSAVTGG